MSRLIRHLLLMNSGATAAQLYASRVLATSPLRYNKLNEASGTAIVDSSGNGYTGTYTGVDLANTDSPFLPDKAPFWDGTNDYGDLYSAGFGTAFNLDEFTVMVWAKMNSSAVWTDAANRRIVNIQRDSNNVLFIGKSSINNTVLFRRIGSSTTKTVTLGSLSYTNWTCYAISVSVAGGGLLAAGDLRAYINGVEVGTVQTGNIASAGTGLSATTTTLGAASTVPGSVHHGWLAHAIIWNRPIDAAILALMIP